MHPFLSQYPLHASGVLEGLMTNLTTSLFGPLVSASSPRSSPQSDHRLSGRVVTQIDRVTASVAEQV
jgi:hypothetical protein